MAAKKKTKGRKVKSAPIARTSRKLVVRVHAQDIGTTLDGKSKFYRISLRHGSHVMDLGQVSAKSAEAARAMGKRSFRIEA